MWNTKKFFIIQSLVLFLLLSLFWIEPLQVLWQKIDSIVFRACNDYLRERPLQQVFWATSNIKITDLFGALLLVSLFCTFIFEAKGEERKRRIVAFLFTLVWFEVSILFCKQVLTPLCEYYKISRHSPTVDLHHFVSLSSVIPWLKVKDSSYFCFPADHGAIVIQWCMLFCFFSDRFRGTVAFLSTLFLLLPRLISGAHWFSDVAVGSLSISLFAYGWATCSPFYTILYRFLCRLLKVEQGFSKEVSHDL